MESPGLTELAAAIPRRLHNFIDDVPAGLLAIGPDLRVVDANASFARLAGTSQARLLGRNGMTLIHPDDHLMVLRSIELITSAPDRTFTASVRMCRDDGEHVHVEIDASVITPGDDVAFVLSVTAASTSVEIERFVETAVRGDDLRSALASLVRAIEGYQTYRASVHWATDDRNDLDEDVDVVTVDPQIAAITSNPTIAAMIWANRNNVGARIVLNEVHGGAVVDRLLARSEQRAAVLFPIVAGDEAMGCIAVWSRHNDYIGPAGVRFVERMASLASLALRQDVLDRRLRTLAHTDSLTGASNRAVFTERLGHAVDAGNGVVVLLDIDQFKQINDSHGHGVGDEVLLEVATRLRASLPGACVARLGGDEFGILTFGIDRQDDDDGRLAAARRVQHAIEVPFHISVGALAVRCSVGAALVSQSTNVPDLLATADRAMYEAKRSRISTGLDGS